MTTSKANIPNNNLEDALKELNSAIEGWEKITSKPPMEQDVSFPGIQKPTEEILERLREQINELSKD